MMRNLLIFFAVLSLFSTSAFALEKDKKQHLAVSAAISFATQSVVDDYRISMATCATVGLAKEIYDEVDYGGFSERDLVADLIGCGAGIALNEVTGLKFNVNSLPGGYMLNVGWDF
ncbi:hypothetical protein [Vibrio owensii]|uniref:hypothetical protein n=1 Tax=Vibrio harveyi group TaxID=717610 RepID=UPI003CC697BE